MEPKKKIILPKRRSAKSINNERINKAKAYANEAPTIGNLYNAFVNWFNATLNKASDYITGQSPVGGKKLQILSPLQLKTLMPRDAAVYRNAINRITERDALRQLLKQMHDNRLLQDELSARIAENEVDLNAAYEDDGFDPEMEWLEYKYGGTDSYPYMYNQIARRRGLLQMDESGLWY